MYTTQPACQLIPKPRQIRDEINRRDTQRLDFLCTILNSAVGDSIVAKSELQSLLLSAQVPSRPPNLSPKDQSNRSRWGRVIRWFQIKVEHRRKRNVISQSVQSALQVKDAPVKTRPEVGSDEEVGNRDADVERQTPNEDDALLDTAHTQESNDDNVSAHKKEAECDDADRMVNKLVTEVTNLKITAQLLKHELGFQATKEDEGKESSAKELADVGSTPGHDAINSQASEMLRYAEQRNGVLTTNTKDLTKMLGELDLTRR